MVPAMALLRVPLSCQHYNAMKAIRLNGAMRPGGTYHRVGAQIGTATGRVCIRAVETKKRAALLPDDQLV